VLAATAVAGLAEKVSELKRQLPVGYKIVEGGSVEESAKGQNSVLAVFPIVVVLMITVLMFQMQSFSRLFLVCSVAPWASLVSSLRSWSRKARWGSSRCWAPSR
jgi:multidrug efflux pump subunit AcrB